MRDVRTSVIWAACGGILALAVLALGWASAIRPSQAQQGAMQNCPQPGKWAISVWSGDNGADPDNALATCGEAAVAAAYHIDPVTQTWSRWFAGKPDISNLPALDDMQGVMALGGAGVAPTPTPSLTPAPTATGTPVPLSCTRYVATSGDDGNTGTFESPWRTLQHAADVAQAGDIVCVHAGAYSEDVAFSGSGTAEAAITFAAAPGETVTVQGSLTLAPGTSHLQLIGFALQGFPIWGLTLEGDNHHVLLSHLNVAGGEAGVRMTDGNSGEDPQYGAVSDVVLEDSVIRDSAYTAVDCTPGPCDHTTFRRLEISGAGLEAGFGGDGLGLERGQDVVVEDCYIHDNGGDGIDLNSRDFAGNVTGIVVRRNRVVRNHLQGIKLWSGGRMENNAIWGQGIDPVMLGAHPGTYEVVNNTIAYNMYSDFAERDYSFVAAYPAEGPSPAIQLTLVNNIFAFNTGPELGTPTGIYLGEGVQLTEHHNLYWSRDDGEIEAEFVSGHDPAFTRAEITDGTWTAVTGQGQGNVTTDPVFASGWSEVDLHLQAGSPAVDAGSAADAPSEDAEGRPRGGAPDIGAYER